MTTLPDVGWPSLVDALDLQARVAESLSQADLILRSATGGVETEDEFVAQKARLESLRDAHASVLNRLVGMLPLAEREALTAGRMKRGTVPTEPCKPSDLHQT